METVKIRNLIIGEGMPKICVPIVGITKKDILAQAQAMTTLPADMIEWRADWFEDVFNFKSVLEVLSELRVILNDIPILFTFRTAKEGGEKEIVTQEYAKLNKSAAATGLIDLIDVEAFLDNDLVMSLISEAHEHDVKVVASNHDFEKTPTKEEIVSRLCTMQDMGADIAKIAVMPRTKHDVLTLLAASLEMSEQHAHIPVVSISMANDGLISRFSGEILGSAITFAATKKASAPGQIGVADLRKVLEIIHRNF